MTDAVAPIPQDFSDGRPPVADRLRAMLAGHGVWALGDQGILSLGNFLTNLAIYRRFSKTASGDYYIVLSFILFLNNLHMALVTYPLSITVGTVTDAEFRRRTAGRGSSPAGELLEQSRAARLETLTGTATEAGETG